MTGDGWRIRAATVVDAADIAAVQCTAWRETYRGLIPDALIDAMDVAERTLRWTRILSDESTDIDGAAFVAEGDGAVCGFLTARRQTDDGLAARGVDGEISAIYVLQAAQGQGIGRALMAAGAGHLLAVGCHAASVWGLDSNANARGFYGRLGGRVVGTKDDVRDEGVLPHTAYAWDRLDVLTAPPSLLDQ